MTEPVDHQTARIAREAEGYYELELYNEALKRAEILLEQGALESFSRAMKAECFRSMERWEEGIAAFEDLRSIAGELTTGEVAIFAHARSLVDWHARHQHCPVCSGDTTTVLGGANRRCIDCSAEHFPRTDPVAIAVVVRGERCLLGRGPAWPDTM